MRLMLDAVQGVNTEHIGTIPKSKAKSAAAAPGVLAREAVLARLVRAAASPLLLCMIAWLCIMVHHQRAAKPQCFTSNSCGLCLIQRHVVRESTNSFIC
jgi:hypothetical protein